jgi:hypothetical protein
MGMAKVRMRVGHLYVAVGPTGAESRVRLLYRDKNSKRWIGSDGYEYYMDGRARGSAGTLRTLIKEVSERIWMT